MSKLKPKLKINIPTYSINIEKEKQVIEPSSAKNSAYVKGKSKLNEMPSIYRQSPNAGKRPSSISKKLLVQHVNDTPPILQNAGSQGSKPTKLKEITFNPAKTFSPNYLSSFEVNRSKPQNLFSKNSLDGQVSASNLSNSISIGNALSNSVSRAKSKDRSTPSTTKHHVIVRIQPSSRYQTPLFSFL